MESTKLLCTLRAIRTSKTTDGRYPFHPILMMHASSQSGITYEEFMCDYEKLVESNLKCIELYDHDAVSVISDPFRETSAFGAQVIFNGDDAPKAEHIIKTREDVQSLQQPDVYACERTLDRINGVKLFREKLGEEFPVIGWVEGPLAEASDLMGMSELFIAMFTDPEMIRELCDKCLVMAKIFAKAQIDAGANIIGVGDAVCSQISVDQYKEYGYPYHKELFKYIHDQGGLVKLHICGNISHLLELIAEEDVDILDIDAMVDMQTAYEKMGIEVVLCGNIDPVSVIMNGDKDSIKCKFEEIKNSIPRENWILMGGCEIPMNTPEENMIYLREISK